MYLVSGNEVGNIGGEMNNIFVGVINDILMVQKFIVLQIISFDCVVKY